QNQEWINTHGFLRFLGTGVKWMAVVQPKSVIAAMSVNSIVSKVEGTDLTTSNVKTVEEALAWIKGEKVLSAQGT
ncbi:MAG: hypothetical protein AAGA85_28170, partial [Bacteroidota bacterium]